MPLRWRSDLSKLVLKANFDRRGWVETEDDHPSAWDLYWASTASLPALFGADAFVKLRPDQRVNHFPNQHELTRKDLLLKNVNRYVKQMQREGRGEVPALLPPSYALPADYGLFVEECRRNPPGTTYIMKPTAKAQGKGIFLVNKLSQVRAWSNAGAGGQPPGGQLPGGLLSSGAPGGNSNSSAANNAVGSSGNTNSNSSSSTFTSVLRPGQDNYVVSRYISDPLLLGGKKFDLRLYVVVPCYAPLTVYLSDLGFARFCNLKYTSEVAQLDNMYVHLTNVAVQQQGGADFNPAHGNKWALRDLLLYLAAVRGEAATQQLVSDIRVLVVHTLKAVQPVMINDRNCFELYGFDVIIDAALKPWLIEVNASPSLSTTSTADRLLKYKVVQDTLDIVLPEAGTTAAAAGRAGGTTGVRMAPGTSGGSPSSQTTSWRPRVGSMQLIYDEASSGPRLQHQRSSKAGLAAQAAAAAAVAAAGGGGGGVTGSLSGSGAGSGAAGSSKAAGRVQQNPAAAGEGGGKLPALGQPKKVAVLRG